MDLSFFDNISNMERVIRVKKDRENYSRKESSEFTQIFDSIFVKIFLVGVSVFILWAVYNSVNITFQKLDILRRAEREVEDLRIQNLYLSISMREMSTGKYLEKEARDRLNFGDTGEIVFVIPDNVMSQADKDIEGILRSDDENILELDFTLSSWVDFIMKGI